MPRGGKCPLVRLGQAQTPARIASLLLQAPFEAGASHGECSAGITLVNSRNHPTGHQTDPGAWPFDANKIRPGTNVLLVKKGNHATLPLVKSGKARDGLRSRLSEKKVQSLFYVVFLPLGAIANLVLGLVILTQLRPAIWTDWLLVATGAFCCMIAGWLAAAAWSKSYWNRSMARQVAMWRRIADAIFVWLEDAPVPAESLHNLKSSLDEVVPNSKVVQSSK